ncbi:MAG: hypothetical protein ACREGR_02545 [Minisyncoccia bacterium]
MISRFLSRCAPLLVLALPASAHAASITVTLSSGNGCSSAVCGIATTILNLINGVLVPLLFAIAFIVFLWGVARAYIFSGGDAEAVGNGHRLILWGIIGFVVMISLWGLVNVVASTFGLTGGAAPPLPQSQGSSAYTL